MTAATVPAPTPAREIEVISVVGFAHGVSHFFHLLIPPLFPWLMPEFGLSYTEVGMLMTVFFVVSGIGQAAAGFVVDRLGPLRVLLAAVVCFALAAALLASAQSYAMLALAAALAGLGNCPLHPADFTLLNRRVTPARLGHAFSVHGLTGYAGWALAPVFMAGLATSFHWRVAAAGAAGMALLALALLVARRAALRVDMAVHRDAAAGGSVLGFLGVATVWMCFGYFLLSTLAFGALQNFAPSLLRDFYGLSLAAATTALTTYLMAAAGGTVLGGFLAAGYKHEDRLIALALSGAAAVALVLSSGALPAWSVLFWMAGMGFLSGIAGPSRDLLVRHAATSRFGQGAYGRVYGFVYSGLDIGLAGAPLLFGPLMDGGRFAAVLGGVALLQGLAILTALRVGARSR